MKKINNMDHRSWFVEITGSQGELLFRAEKADISVYKDTEVNAYYVYLERNNSRELQGIYAGNVTISMMPEN